MPGAARKIVLLSTSVVKFICQNGIISTGWECFGNYNSCTENHYIPRYIMVAQFLIFFLKINL